MVAQSLFLCLLVSAVGGVMNTSGNAVVVYTARRQKRQEASGQLQKAMVISGFIFFNGLANVCLFLAPWFGPVSIFWPIYIACKLLSNMVLIGFLMGHEKLDKNGQVATMVVVTAVLYITITGPETQDGQKIDELFLGNTIGMIWLGFLVAAYIACIILVAFGSLKDKSPAFSEMILFIIATCSSTLGGTISKLGSLLDGSMGPYKTIMIVASWFILTYWSYANFLEAKYVPSLARYLPKVTFGAILLNAITGLLIWEDQKVIRSWAGYIAAICLLGMGVYLLSDLDFFKAQAQDRQDFHRQIESLQDFLSSIETDLSRARIERSLTRHQITIIENSARQGLARGASDPEINTKTKDSGELNIRENEDKEAKATVSPSFSPNRPRRLSSLESIESLTHSFRSLQDLVGIDLEKSPASSGARKYRHDSDSTKTGSLTADDSSISSKKSTFGGDSDDADSTSTQNSNRRHDFMRQSSGLLELSNHSFSPNGKRRSSLKSLRSSIIHLSLQEDLEESAEGDSSLGSKEGTVVGVDDMEGGSKMPLQVDLEISDHLETPQKDENDNNLDESGKSGNTSSIKTLESDLENQMNSIMDEIMDI